MSVIDKFLDVMKLGGDDYDEYDDYDDFDDDYEDEKPRKKAFGEKRTTVRMDTGRMPRQRRSPRR